INMKYSSMFVRLRFFPGAYGNLLYCVTYNTVRIGKHEAAFVVCSWFESEDASRELMRRRVVPPLFMTVDLFAANAKQGMAIAPLLFALLPIIHSYGGISVVVARNDPLKARADERRRFHDKM